VANLIIQPVGASLDDLNPAIREFNGLVNSKINKNNLAFVINHLSSSAEEKATRNYLEKANYFVFPIALEEKISYREAHNLGKIISEVKYLRLKKKVQLLIKEILKKLIAS
jgi:chromosome partitioning protein